MDEGQGATTEGPPTSRHPPDWTVLAPLRSNPYVTDVATSVLLTPEECAEVLASLEPEGWKEMEVWDTATDAARSHRRAQMQHVRRGRLRAIPGGNHGPLGTRIADRVREINDEYFRFRIVGIEDAIQVLWYGSENADGYVVHMDLGPATSMRKLSFSLLLSDPDTYEGGDLCFPSDPLPLARAQGVLTVFPSFREHAVSPVTAGERFAAVGFVMGPAFA